jgi:small subunit ribosomal protein S29
MATPTCWKCLLRPSTANTFNGRIVPLVSSFSTTATVALPAPAKKKPAQNARAPTKAAKTLRIKKKTVVKAGRPPAPGERKAIRKRIVLSNSNALEVLGLTDMTPKLDAAQVGKVHALPDAVVDKLRAVEAFKTTQGWSLFRKPAMLVRDKSVELANSMLTAAEAKKTKTMVIDGTRGAGKSMMLLQAMSTAFQNGWIVLNIPEGKHDRTIDVATTDAGQKHKS